MKGETEEIFSCIKLKSLFLKQNKYITESIKGEIGSDTDIPGHKVREILRICVCNKYGQTTQWGNEIGKVIFLGVTLRLKALEDNQRRKTRLKSVVLFV